MADPGAYGLDERVRQALSARGAQAEERRMFGGLVFMVDGEILVSARKGEGLLVRCDPARCDELTSRPGARTATMGERDMGPSWLDVDADALTSDEALAFWLDVAQSRPR